MLYVVGPVTRLQGCEKGTCERSGDNTTLCAGPGGEIGWPTSAVMLITDSFLTNWDGTLPHGWFYYNCYEELSGIHDEIAGGIVP